MENEKNKGTTTSEGEEVTTSPQNNEDDFRKEAQREQVEKQTAEHEAGKDFNGSTAGSGTSLAAK